MDERDPKKAEPKVYYHVVRPPIEQLLVIEAVQMLEGALRRRQEKHGNGMYAGPHEILGILEEEFDELKDAVRGNDRMQAVAELEDIAVAAIFGMASLCQQLGGRWENAHPREFLDSLQPTENDDL